MKLTFRPFKLKLCFLLSLTFIFIFVLNTKILLNLPWWQISKNTTQFAAGLALALFLPLSVLIWNGKKNSFYYYCVVFFVWFSFNAATSLQSQHVLLAFFTLFLTTYKILFLILLNHTQNTSYLSSGKSWFESRPIAISGLSAQTTKDSKHAPVSRFNYEGAYIMADCSNFSPEIVRFLFKDQTFECPYKIVGTDSYGFGVQFNKIDLDMKKELSDFIERINGEGHEIV